MMQFTTIPSALLLSLAILTTSTIGSPLPVELVGESREIQAEVSARELVKSPVVYIASGNSHVGEAATVKRAELEGSYVDIVARDDSTEPGIEAASGAVEPRICRWDCD